MSDVKIRDVFELPMIQGSIVLMSNDRRNVIEFDPSHSNVGEQIQYVAHAINNHDRLVEENAQLKSQLHDLFEHVSGVSVNEYKQEQMPYLADYIIGQAESDSMCIEKLKADKAELVELIEVSCDRLDRLDSWIESQRSYEEWVNMDELEKRLAKSVSHLYKLIQKHKGGSNTFKGRG